MEWCSHEKLWSLEFEYFTQSQHHVALIKTYMMSYSIKMFFLNNLNKLK